MQPRGAFTTGCSLAARPARLTAIILTLALLGCQGPDGTFAAEADTPESGTTTQALAPGVRQWVVFNDPTSTVRAEAYAITDKLIELIDGTPPGESIHITIHQLEANKIREALTRAKTRGAIVRAVVSGNVPLTRDGVKTDAGLLQDALGGNFVYCSAPNNVLGCISARANSIMHTKFATFSYTSAAGANTVIFGSFNLTVNAADGQYNNAVIVSGDATTFSRFNLVFEDMFYRRRNNNYQQSANGSFSSSGAALSAWFQPRADSAGGTSEEESTDVVVSQALNDLSTSTTGCYLKIAQNMITNGRDPFLTKHVKRIRDDLRCSVQIIYNSMGSDAATTLSTSSRRQLAGVHHKYFIMHGTLNGVANQTRVYTGSHNWSDDALRLNDEVLVRLTDPAVVNQFVAHFDALWCRAGGGTSCSPVHAIPPENLHLLGVGSGNAVYDRHWEGNWSGWSSLGPDASSDPDAYSWGRDHLDVYIRGSDNQLWQKPWTATGGWTAWYPLGGYLTSSPAVCSWGRPRVDVFARNASGTLSHRWYHASSGWSVWGDIGAPPPGIPDMSGPACASWTEGPGAEHISIFVRGADDALWHKAWLGTGWSGWESLGGLIKFDPAVASWGPRRLDVFAVGRDDNAVHTRAWNGTWHPWSFLGGVATSSPGATSWGPDRIDVFIRGTDNGFHHLAWDGTWHGWNPLGGVLISGPAAVSMSK
jgi:phosphatidylserine/phosphatidylglycerophosphate/cardiolipin synthase-like enzyme